MITLTQVAERVTKLHPGIMVTVFRGYNRARSARDHNPGVSTVVGFAWLKQTLVCRLYQMRICRAKEFHGYDNAYLFD